MNAIDVLILIEAEIAKSNESINYIGDPEISDIIEIMEALGFEWSEEQLDYVLKCNPTEQLEFYRGLLTARFPECTQ